MKRILTTLTIVLAALVLSAGCAKNGPSGAESQNAAAVGRMPEMVICSIDSTGQVQMMGTDSIPKFEYKGKTYYFSSKACRDVIVADPEKYLGSETPGMEQGGRTSQGK